MKIIIPVLSLLILFIGTTSAQYKIDRFVFGSGGGLSAGTSYKVSLTVGQLLTGTMGSVQYKSNAGFWYTVSYISDIKDKNTIPDVFDLFQNYPNPFNPTTTIRYQIPEESNVSLRLYNLIGEEVAVLVNSVQTAGVYEVEWNAAGLSSGFYIYRLEAGKFVSVKKLIILK